MPDHQLQAPPPARPTIAAIRKELDVAEQQYTLDLGDMLRSHRRAEGRLARHHEHTRDRLRAAYRNQRAALQAALRELVDEGTTDAKSD